MDKVYDSESVMDRIQQKLARSRARYKVKLVGLLDELAALLNAGRKDGDAMEQAQRLAHKICGSAGTFGFKGVSEAVGAIDRDLLGVLSGQLSPTTAFWRRVEQRVLQAQELG